MIKYEQKAMKPYKPSQIVPFPSGWIWLILSSALGGAAIGGVTFAISRVIYLIVFFPMMIGCFGGLATAFGVKQGKVRNPLVIYFFAIVTGLSIYSSLYTAEYLNFRQESLELINKKLGEVDEKKSNQLLEEFLQDETGSQGFLGFLKLSAKEGVSIGESDEDAIKLNETFTWIYWLSELVIIQGIIFSLAHLIAKEPFCESCQKWYSNREKIGSVNEKSSPEFLQLIKQENFTDSGRLIKPGNNHFTAGCKIYLRRCPTCPTSDLVLVVTKATPEEHSASDFTPILQGMISRSQEIQLKSGMEEREANIDTP
jgi:hypothetical protein